MDIVITAAYGDEDKEVRITKPFGGGHQYHIYIDNYFKGQIIYTNDKWSIPDQPELTSDDIQILTGLIEQNENNS